MLLKANFFLLKKGREPKLPARALCGSFQCSVTAAATAAAAIAAAFAAAAAPTAAAAMLVGVPCDPAHTAKHDDCHDDRRQIKVRGEKFHHTKHTLSVQSVLLDLGDVDFDLVITSILVGTDQQVDEANQNHSSHDGEEVEADLTSDDAAQLVNHQSGAVSQSAHITNGDGGPLAVVHLALDGAHSSEAGSAQQVEDHEGVSRQSGVVLRNSSPDLIAVLRQLAAEVIQNTEGADDVLLCD